MSEVTKKDMVPIGSERFDRWIAWQLWMTFLVDQLKRMQIDKERVDGVRR